MRCALLGRLPMDLSDAHLSLLPPKYCAKLGRKELDPSARHELLELHEHLFSLPMAHGEEGIEVFESSMKLVLFTAVISIACGIPLYGGLFWGISPALALGVFLPGIFSILTTPTVLISHIFNTVTEEMRDDTAIGQVLQMQREDKFLNGLETLVQMSILLDQSAKADSDTPARTDEQVELSFNSVLFVLTGLP